MNFIDIILIILLALSAIHGFRKGLIIELATFAALLIGLLAGFYLSDIVAGIIIKNFDYSGKYISIISFMVIFITVIVLVQIIARMIEKAVKAIALGFLNKFAGAIFCTLKAAIILSVIIFFLNGFDSEQKIISKESRDNSTLFPIIENIAPTILPTVRDFYDTYYPVLKEKIETKNP